MLGAVILTGNPESSKNSFSGYGTGFDYHSIFWYPNFDWCKNVVIFGVDNSISVHINNKKKDSLVLGEV